MSPEVQVKFLRVLETQEFTSDLVVKGILRLMSELSPLQMLILQHRLNKKSSGKISITASISFVSRIPPLRDRREDIPFFVSAFISELSTEHGKPITSITSEALNYLQNANWYGNVRELRNAIETAIILAATEELQLKDFPMRSGT